MQTLIDKVKVAESSNIATVGFKTLLILLTNGASGASDYSGTAAEAEAIKDDTTITAADNSSGTDAVAIDDEYIKIRTQADSKNAFIEVVLGDAYVSTITLPDDITATAIFLTQPSNSEV